MGAAHKAIANNANTDRFFAHLCDRLEKEAEGARLNVGQYSDTLFFVFEGILIEGCGRSWSRRIDRLCLV